MHFANIALASAALATTAFAAPPPNANVWHRPGYGGWGKGKAHPYAPAPTPAPYAPAPTPAPYQPGPSQSLPAPAPYPTQPAPTSSPQPPPPPPAPQPYPGQSDPTPQPTPGHNETECPTVPSQCLTDEQAAAGAEIFRQLIQEYSDELALEALTEDFVDYSSAVNIIRNRGNEGPFVVNAVSFDGRAAFMAAQGSQPQIPFNTLNTFHGCNHVATRWQTLRSANGQPTEANDIPVVGNGILVTVPDSENSYGFRVKELYSEFNAAAWLVNNGVFTPSAVTTSNPPIATPGPAKRDHDSLAHLMGAAGRMI